MESSPGEGCLGHEGTLKLLESWREILRERQLKDDDEIRNNTITLSVGPQFEEDIARIFILYLYDFKRYYKRPMFF